MIIIPGFTTDDKVPGVVARNIFGAGRQSVGAAPLACVLMGSMDESAGSMTPNASREPCFSEEEADALAGPRSELARMAHAALEVPGVLVYLVPVDEPGGAAAAVSGGVVGGTWTTAGEIVYQFDEEIIRIAIGATDTIDEVGANIVDAVNQAQNGRLFCTASFDTGTDTLTFTTNSLGVRGNQHTFWLDLSNAPSGFTLTQTGGTPLANGGVPFASGSGSDDVDAALTFVESVANDYIGAAHNDATNVGKIETKVNEKAAFDIGLLEHYIVSTNGNLTAATSLAQTTMNDQLGRMAWVQWGVEHPSRIAARLAALMSVTDGAQPNTNYDGVTVPGAAPQFRLNDVPNRTTLKAALNVGVLPLVTEDGELNIVRAITSRSLNGSTPDYRTLDHSESVVPVRARKELVSLGQLARENNPYAGPDVGDQPPPEGVLTPNLWNQLVYGELKEWESSTFNWLQDVDNNLPASTWDSDAERIMSLVDLVVRAQNHQIGIVVRQRAA